MNQITHGKILLKGIAFSLPIALTLFILVWTFRTAENMLAKPMQWILPEALQFPGMGIVVCFFALYLLGWAIHGRFLSFIFNWIDNLLSRLPLVNLLYDNIKELTEFLSGAKDADLERVVLVTLQDNVKAIGFVTRQNPNLPRASADSEAEPIHAVYVPMSYQMGGFTLYLPESSLENLDISTQEAMQRVLTADISGGGNGDDSSESTTKDSVQGVEEDSVEDSAEDSSVNKGAG